MRPGKCPNCGANIKVDENNNIGICEYCGSTYSTENAVANFNNTTNNNNASVINYYYTAPIPEYKQPQAKVNKEIKFIPKRPEVNVPLAILGFIFYIFPGLIYILYVKGKQQEWDEKYAKEVQNKELN